MGVLDAPASLLRTRQAVEAHADTGPANTVSETTLAQLAIPTTLFAGEGLRFVAYGDQLNNSGSAVNYTYIFYIGTTAVLSVAASSMNTSSNRRRWSMVVDIDILDPAASERAGGVLLVGAASATNVISSSSTNTGPLYGTAAEDLTSAKNAKLTATLSNNLSTIDCICHFAALQVFKKA